MLVNNFMNQIDRLQQPTNPVSGKNHGFLTRHVVSRVATATLGTAIEVANIALNIFKVPCQLIGATLKVAVGTVAYLTNANVLKNLNRRLPGVDDVFVSIAKVIVYSIGAFSTATIGLISPTANFNLHCGLGIARNERSLITTLAAPENAEVLEALEQIIDQKINEPTNEEIAVDTTKNSAQTLSPIFEDEVEETDSPTQTTSETVNELATTDECPLLAHSPVSHTQEETDAIVAEQALKVLTPKANVDAESLPNDAAKTQLDHADSSEDKEVDFVKEGGEPAIQNPSRCPNKKNIGIGVAGFAILSTVITAITTQVGQNTLATISEMFASNVINFAEAIQSQ